MKDGRGTDRIGPVSAPGKNLRPNRRDVDESRGALRFARPMQFVQSFADDKSAGASAAFVANAPKGKAKGRDTADAPIQYTVKP